ncbi:MAG: T9SS type A sorting domain-containing protein [Chlorobi bacterium]|nr:T9SS type A sorting domain-containing protein [Chlorobiota bacterium]
MKLSIIFLPIFLLPFLCVGQNQNISNGDMFDGEPYIAINPENPQHLVVAWMGYVLWNKIQIKTRVSFDGGKNWSDPFAVPHVNNFFTSADPSLDFDSEGNVYLGYIDYNKLIDSGAVYVRKSVDNGLSWGEAAKVIGLHDDEGKKPIDRPWMSVDRSNGESEGDIYITTMNIKEAWIPPFNPYLTKSVDGGTTFDAWRYVDTADWLAGSLIPQPMPTNAISGDGTFYCVYPSWVFSQNFLPQYIIAASADGGASFDYHTVFETGAVLNDSLAKKGYLLRLDPADFNHLVFLYIGVPNGDADVLMRESFDKGETWTEEIRVNDDPVSNSRMQDLLWADFDFDGDFVVSWRDRRNSPDTGYITSYEIWGAFREAGSNGFQPNFKISDIGIGFDTVLNSAGNDFMCIKIQDDTINVVWGDTRNGFLNIWFQRLDIFGNPLSVKQIAHDKQDILVYPNPANTEICIQLKSAIDEIQIRSVSGGIIYSQNGLKQKKAVVNVSGFPPGIYFVHVYSLSGEIVRRVVLE